MLSSASRRGDRGLVEGKLDALFVAHQRDVTLSYLWVHSLWGLGIEVRQLLLRKPFTEVAVLGIGHRPRRIHVIAVRKAVEGVEPLPGSAGISLRHPDAIYRQEVFL